VYHKTTLTKRLCHIASGQVKIIAMDRLRILVNVAMTADGKIDSTARKGADISSTADKVRVDRLRASVDAVLVGGQTLLNEDPKLTVKSAELRAERFHKGWPENPAKVGIVSELLFLRTISIPYGDNIHFGDSVRSEPGGTHAPLWQFMTSGPAQVYLFTTRCTPPEVLEAFETGGATVRAMGQERVDLEAVFRSLYEVGIRSVLVEGGGTLIAELLRLGLVDELTIYIAPKIFGGSSAPTLADGDGFLAGQAPGLKLESVEEFDDEGGILVHYSIENKE
jgi:2,5-diamino-6-(ribosylamino)-4(3H)-pyrimidinone 5'-phosphate reductase